MLPKPPLEPPRSLKEVRTVAQGASRAQNGVKMVAQGASKPQNGAKKGVITGGITELPKLRINEKNTIHSRNYETMYLREHREYTVNT